MINLPKFSLNFMGQLWVKMKIYPQTLSVYRTFGCILNALQAGGHRFDSDILHHCKTPVLPK